jgi:hypothetical protein
MHFYTAAPATVAETYWEYTLDIDATSGMTYIKNVTTNSPIM